MKYPGDTLDKVVSRQRLYDCVAEMWQDHRPLGDAVVLAGPEAPEVDLLPSLGFLPGQCLFVDRSPACRATLDNIPKLMPGARTFFGELEVVIPTMDRIAFANLDLMGSVSYEASRILEMVGPRMSKGGVVAYTFHKSRETYHTSSGTRFFQRMGGIENLTRARRWEVVRELIKEALGRDTRTIFERDYTSRGRIGVLALEIQR